MLTDEIIRKGYLNRYGWESREHYHEVLTRFLIRFDCLDCDTYEEAMDKLVIAVKTIWPVRNP